MSNDISINNLRAMHAATTQGEWAYDGDAEFGYFYIWSDGKSLCIQIGCGRSPTCHEPAIAKSESNSIFIAAAHNILPALLDELERLQQNVAELTKACEQYQEHSREIDTECARLRGENELRQEAALVAIEERDDLCKKHHDSLDTIKAMLVACGGSEDDAELKAQLDAAGSKPSDFIAAIGGRLLGLISNWTSSGRYGYSLPVIQVELMSDIERILRGEKRVEFVRQVPDGKDGFVDRFAYPSLQDLQDAVKSPGASGARGIMRDHVTGEEIVVVEPSRITCPRCEKLSSFDELKRCEGVCEACCDELQAELDKFNAQIDQWESLSDEERDAAIRAASN